MISAKYYDKIIKNKKIKNKRDRDSDRNTITYIKVKHVCGLVGSVSSKW